MVKYLKESRLAVTRFLSGHPLTGSEMVGLTEGWPTWLIFLKPMSKDLAGRKLLLTLLTSFRGMSFEPVLDTAPITNKWGGYLSLTERELNHIMKQLVRTKPDLPRFSQYHMSTKSGPIGQAITSAITELTLLPQQLIDAIVLLGGPKLGSHIDSLLQVRWGSLSLATVWSTIFKAKRQIFRKISYFSDKEGKTRVVAILDYWSQTCLKPFHDSLNGILRGIKQDCTYNQDKVATWAKSSHGPYYSLDLSNATDRMPLALQQRIISWLYGEDISEAWALVLVGFEYAIKGGPSVKYGAGQPMGAYSSWPAMALTHHFIVRWAAMRCGLPHFTQYIILGDDLVIAHAEVAAAYIRLLKELDMPISTAKSHISDDIFEFAKRWFMSGTEMTGFSVSGLYSVWGNYALLHNYIQTQLGHGWSLSTDKHPGLISAIYRLFGKPSQAVRVIKLYMVFDSVAKAISSGPSLAD